MSSKKDSALAEKVKELEKTNKMLLEQLELLATQKVEAKDKGEFEAVAVIQVDGAWSFVKIPFSLEEASASIKEYTQQYGIQKTSAQALYKAKEHLIFKLRGIR